MKLNLDLGVSFILLNTKEHMGKEVLACKCDENDTQHSLVEVLPWQRISDLSLTPPLFFIDWDFNTCI